MTQDELKGLEKAAFASPEARASLIALAKYLLTLAPLKGNRTYLSAAMAIALGVWLIYSGQIEQGIASITAGIGLQGLRGAIPTPPTEVPSK